MRFLTCLVLLGILLFPYVGHAKRAANRPYVQSMNGGSVIYARCIPDEGEGSRGVTQILRVRKEGDEVLHEYRWYNKHGVVLGWSPKAGKVAVLRFRQEEGKELEKQIELSFYLGGKLLKSYTTADLLKLGAQITRTSADVGPHASYKVMGCMQVPGTNDYYFSIKLADDTVLRFDVLSGNLCRLVENRRTVRDKTGVREFTEYRLERME